MSTVSDIGRNVLVLIKSVAPGEFQDGVVFKNDAGNPSGSTFGIDANPTPIPPLGTINYDGNPTAEDDQTVTAGGVEFLRNQAIMGAFQFVEGKSSLSISEDFEKIELVDFNTLKVPKQYVKGIETYSGSLELWKKDAESLWSGAVRGEWDSELKRYVNGACFRQYELWLLVAPNELNETATEAHTLFKLINVTFDKNDIAISGNPIRYTIPISWSKMEEYLDWDDGSTVAGLLRGVITPIQQDDQASVTGAIFTGYGGQSLLGSVLLGGAVAGDTTLIGDGGVEVVADIPLTFNFPKGTDIQNSNKQHTRLFVDFFNGTWDSAPAGPAPDTGVFVGMNRDTVDTTTDLEVEISGTDAVGNRISETFFFADIDASLTANDFGTTAGTDRVTILTSNYYKGGFDIVLKAGNDPVAASRWVMNVFDADYMIQSGIPLVNTADYTV